jgi:Ca2+-binding EF-hand superfamily protein
MTKTLRSASFIAALATALPLAALAQTGQSAQPGQKSEASTPEVAFMKADANGDGKLSKAEAARMPALAAKFDTLDKDKDGMLSMGEYMTAFEAPTPKQ